MHSRPHNNRRSLVAIITDSCVDVPTTLRNRNKPSISESQVSARVTAPTVAHNLLLEQCGEQ